MDKCMWLQYPSSVEQIVEINESFDAAILKICYSGANRNGSKISKEAIEKAIPTMYNCPIVCNYDVYEDTIGGHDIDIVQTNNGYRIINLTDAVGVIPSNCNYYWETISDNGTTHEYLCVEAILWKRASAYSKIKRDGVTSQSMEITVKNGKSVGEYYEIYDFIFTAFCLLGDNIEPCFESASLEVFSLQQYKKQFSEMMTDYKKHFSAITSSSEDDINLQKKLKGGAASLDKMELLSTYGLTVQELDFNIEDLTIDELKERLENFQQSDPVQVEDNTQSTQTTDDTEPAATADGDSTGESTITDANFALTGEQLRSGLCEALYAIKFSDPYWGETYKYLYVDYSFESTEVYCYDCEDWKLYGFQYSVDGDNVLVDFETKKRKKFSIVDFDEGSNETNYQYTFDRLILGMRSVSEERYNTQSQSITNMESELNELRQYKAEKNAQERQNAVADIFSRFSNLDGIEAFEDLKANYASMELDEIENKCYEIQGRQVIVNFSANKPTSTRVVVEDNNLTNEPYGGLFTRFQPKNK